MTPDQPPTTPQAELVLGELNLTVDDLNGHTVDELVDYYDAGFAPPDPSIDNSAGCQLALAAIRRLRRLTNAFLEEDARSQPPLDETWIAGILGQIGAQAQAGRDVPLRLPGADDDGLVITEGAIRAIIRAAGDQVPGLIVGRVSLLGDITRAGEPVTVEVDATVLWGQNIPDSAEHLKHAIAAELGKHTYLNVSSIDVTIHDVERAGT